MKFKKFFPLIFIFAIGFIPLLDLFHPGFPVTHDGQDHIARIANFYQNLQDGNFIPRWAPNLNWGYGHPILMFLYPLPSYVSSFLHFLGFSLVDSVKIFFGLAFILSGFTMYIWLRENYDNYTSITGAVLYLYAPYRFVDLYVRGAIGEHAAFIFPPLILYFLLKISKKYSYRYLIGGSLSTAGLILSHNAISLMFLPIIIFYAGYLIYLSKHKRYLILNTLYLILIGFGLSSFFWIPAFVEGKYTLRNVVTAGGYVNNFINLKDLIYGKWNYGGSGQFTVQIGIINLFSLLSSLFLLIYSLRKKDKRFLLLLFLIIYSLITIFLMLSYSNFIWQKIIILQNFQFPWRFLSVIVFTTSILSVLIINVFSKKIRIILCFSVIIISVLLTRNYWHAYEYSQKPDGFFNDIYYGTTDTGESAPIWSVRFMEHSPKAHLEVISGKGMIKELDRSSTRRNYEIIADGQVRLLENTLYFPGWKILVDDKSADIQFQDPKNRGLMTFYVPDGKHTVEIIFKETKLRYFSDILSVIFLSLIFICYLFLNKIKILKT